MKKIISLILVVSIILSFAGCNSAEGVDKTMTENFIKVKIPFPDTIEDRDSWLTRARYKDTKEVIPLSMSYYDDVYATVPVQNKDREIEAFVPEEISFADKDDSNPDFHSVRMLSRVGVIKGNDRGEANIDDNVTRAEATAMVMRFLGLEGLASEFAKNISAQKGAEFEDVAENEWFYPIVMYARFCGVVEGDSSKTFSPKRNVTREEITVMITRGLMYAGLRCTARDVENFADEDKISDWAKEAYEYIGRNYVSDYDNTDSLNPVRVLNPHKFASRGDIAYILNNTQDDCQLYASELAELFGFDREMPVIDGSTSTYPFTEAVYNALFVNGQTHPQFPQKHSKSHASYQRLINGEVDMLFASVYPASDILKMAEEKGVELELIPIAYDAMVFFTNKDNPISGITKEQISDIYVNDAYDNWLQLGGSDALLYPYCRNNDSGSHAQMERHFLKGGEIHKNVQRETSETMSEILTDVMDAKTQSPVGYALGYSIYYYYQNMHLFYPVEEELKLLAIDGVIPSDETIADGSYPLSGNSYIVLRKDSPKDSPQRKMAEFMLTEAGQVCVENAGYGRLRKETEETDGMSFADKMNEQMPKDKNYMFSPLSIKMALALAANGASGETQSEILNTLGKTDIDEFNELSQDLIKRYSQTDVLCLNIANSVWLNKDKTQQKFSAEFKKKAKDFYDAEVKTTENSVAAKEINSWVEDKTNGKIPQIIGDSEDFLAMLINAIYFKGAWEEEFSETATRPDVFANADGTKSTTDFMNKTDWFKYAETETVKILELPYKNRVEKVSASGRYLGSESFDDVDVSMFLLMPQGDIEAEKELSLIIKNDALQRRYIKLSMPKFKIEYQTKLDEMLKNLGVVSAFDGNKADFYKMFDSGNMMISKTIHKTFINVDEKGTEAAAVTAIALAGTALPPEPMELKFDKPFYFAIRDNISGETLFLGRYAFAK